MLILLGALASGSRTAIVMLAAEAIIFLILKPNETKKLWPALIPAIAVVHFDCPEQSEDEGSVLPQGRAHRPAIEIRSRLQPPACWRAYPSAQADAERGSAKPLFGEGYGTRISGFNELNPNAPILDDQWNNALDVGFIGLAAWGWLMARAVRRLFERPERRPTWTTIGCSRPLLPR